MEQVLTDAFKTSGANNYGSGSQIPEIDVHVSENAEQNKILINARPSDDSSGPELRSGEDRERPRPWFPRPNPNGFRPPPPPEFRPTSNDNSQNIPPTGSSSPNFGITRPQQIPPALRRPRPPFFSQNNRPLVPTIQVNPEEEEEEAASAAAGAVPPFNGERQRPNLQDEGNRPFVRYTKPTESTSGQDGITTDSPNQIPLQPARPFNNDAANTRGGGVNGDGLLQFEISDAVTARRKPSTTEEATASLLPGIGLTEVKTPDEEYLIPIYRPIPVLPDEDLLNEFTENAVPGVEDVILPFDRRQNTRASSANIVQATVVEDIDYARRIRDSTSRIGIGTITSITIGVIALLVFGLLIFLALARRRRRIYETATPTQSRTTITPALADTPSMSDMRSGTGGGGGGFLDDAASSGPPSGHFPDNNQVMPIDGHQTIVSNYNEFLNGGASKNNSILANLPPPSLSESGKVQGTQDLVDDDDYLFTRSPTQV